MPGCEPERLRSSARVCGRPGPSGGRPRARRRPRWPVSAPGLGPRLRTPGPARHCRGIADRQAHRERRPSPGADAAETVPPWAATMAATIESPSPLPPLAAGPGRVGPVEALEDAGAPPRSACPVRCRAPRSRPSSPVLIDRARWRSSPAACGPGRWPAGCRSPGAGGPCPRSPRPDGPPQNCTGHSGPTAAAVCTASDARATSSTGAISIGRPSSSRASMRRSVDQAVHACRLGADPRHDPREVLGVLGGAPLEELGVGRDGGDGRAQLVRGVGDELAQVLLGLPQAGLRGHPGREGSLNPLEHDVERAGQAADLGRLVRAGDALVEVAGGDGVGRALHVLERPQAEPDQPPARRPGRGPARRPSRPAQSGRACAACWSGRRSAGPARGRRRSRVSFCGPHPEGRAARRDRRRR